MPSPQLAFVSFDVEVRRRQAAHSIAIANGEASLRTATSVFLSLDNGRNIWGVDVRVPLSRRRRADHTYRRIFHAPRSSSCLSDRKMWVVLMVLRDC
jgi:hypothetical protein